MTHTNPNAVPENPIDASLDFSDLNQVARRNFTDVDIHTGQAMQQLEVDYSFALEEFLHNNARQGLEAIAFPPAGFSTKNRGLASLWDTLNGQNVALTDRRPLMDTARRAVTKVTARPVFELIARAVIGQATRGKLNAVRLSWESLKQGTWGEVNYRIRNVDSLEGSVVLRRLTRAQRASRLVPRIGSWGVAEAVLAYQPPGTDDRANDAARLETSWTRYGDATITTYFASQVDKGNYRLTFHEELGGLTKTNPERTVDGLTAGRKAVVSILQNAPLPNPAAAKALLKELNVPTR